MGRPMDIGPLGGENIIFKRKFRWTFGIEEFIGGYDGIGAICKTAARPSFKFTSQEVQHVSEKVYLPARPEWDPINITVYDRAGDIQLYSWLRIFYEPTTGQIWPVAEPVLGFRGIAPKRPGILKLYDGHGEIIESWTLQGCWPENITWGDLDYAAPEILDVSFTLRYDRAINNINVQL